MGAGVVFPGQWRRTTTLVAAVFAIAALTAIRGEAHKPITSQFTFNRDVLPIVRAKCGRCHVDGGVAPMSLMTAADATPWAESIRTEVIAGRMPPWPIDTPPGRVVNDGRLTGREMNVLLTWATGGTPEGDPAAAVASAAPRPSAWPLGKPDVELALDAVTIPANQAELVTSFVVSPGAATRRMVRAVDLLPGTAAVVRSARITVQASGSDVERTLAWWEPGEATVPLPAGVGFELPAGARLEVRVRYKKTWQYEGKVVEDRSRIGIYFTDDTAKVVRIVRLDARATVSVPGGVIGSAAGGRGEQMPMRILAVSPDPEMAQVRSAVEIVNRASHTSETIFTMRADPAWPRRYWFTNPISVPAGATWAERFEPYHDPASLTRDAAAANATSSPRALTLDVVAD